MTCISNYSLRIIYDIFAFIMSVFKYDILVSSTETVDASIRSCRWFRNASLLGCAWLTNEHVSNTINVTQQDDTDRTLGWSVQLFDCQTGLLLN